MPELQPPIVQSEYRDVLQTLDALTQQHEKTYRLQVGQVTSPARGRWSTRPASTACGTPPPTSRGCNCPTPTDRPAPQPGRLVTRTEKWGEEIGAWHQEFTRIDAGKWSKAQVARMRSADQAVRAQLDALEAGLPGPPA